MRGRAVSWGEGCLLRRWSWGVSWRRVSRMLVRGGARWNVGGIVGVALEEGEVRADVKKG